MPALCLFLLCALLMPSAVSAAPQRLVALAPSAAEVLLALDCGESVVGRSGDAGPELASVPDVGRYDSPSLESILALRPELCVAVADGMPRPLIARLRALGAAVFVLDVRDFGGLRAELLRLGDVLGRRAKAEEVARHILSRLERAERRLRDAAGPKPSVLFLVQEKPAIAAAQGTFISHLIARAGGRCAVAAQGNVLYPVLGREKLLQLAPDVTLISGTSAAVGPVEAGGFPELGRVCRVDADMFSRPSLRALDALDQLIELLHPRR